MNVQFPVRTALFIVSPFWSPSNLHAQKRMGWTFLLLIQSQNGKNNNNLKSGKINKN